MSEGSVGIEEFGVDVRGHITRTGTAEEFEDAVEEGDEIYLPPVVLGHGRHAKTQSKRYGDDWEEH